MCCKTWSKPIIVPQEGNQFTSTLSFCLKICEDCTNIVYYCVPQSKSPVSTNLKYSRYFHLMLNFSSIHFHPNWLYVHMFDIVDSGRYYLQPWKRIGGLLITSGIFQDKRKHYACDLKCRYWGFTLWGSTTTLSGECSIPFPPTRISKCGGVRCGVKCYLLNTQQ